MRLHYYILDVFTRHKLEGNPLAIVLEADEVDSLTMQRIASEFNLSETVFLMRPRHARHLTSMRIFTKTRELPFAGHPTVGAAVLLGLRHRSTAVRIEEEIGVITAVTEKYSETSGNARFTLPQLPVDAGPAPDAEALSSVLGLTPDEIGFGDHRPSRFSAGVPFTLIPVANAAALRTIKVERRGWQDVFGEKDSSAYVYTQTPEEKDCDLAARMFSPMMGIDEDPATGSAAAALAGAITAFSKLGEGQHAFTLRQGVEMNRPSRIRLQFKIEEGRLSHAAIGGDAVIIGEGKLDLP